MGWAWHATILCPTRPLIVQPHDDQGVRALILNGMCTEHTGAVSSPEGRAAIISVTNFVTRRPVLLLRIYL